MFGERVEGCLDPRLVGESGIADTAKPRDKGAAERVAGEQPVEVAAGNPAI